MTTIAADSRQMPVRRLETTAESTIPNTIPSAVESARSTRKSVIGVVREALPLRTTPANARARTAPVGSFSADSAMIVCDTLARRRIRSNSGMRMAGSVGESAAPMRRPVVSGTPKTAAATPPVKSAVSTTPGMTSMSSPIATLLRMVSESCSPPWKRMKETPSVRMSSRAHGVERDVDRARDRGPEQRSCSEQEQHRRDAQQLREELGPEPGREHQRDREDDVLRRHVARL